MIRMDDEIFEIDPRNEILWKGTRIQMRRLLESIRMQMEDLDEDEVYDFEMIRGFLLYGDLVLRKQDAEIESRFGHQEW